MSNYLQLSIALLTALTAIGGKGKSVNEFCAGRAGEKATRKDWFLYALDYFAAR